MEKPENFYELLGIAKSATELDIAQAYRTLVQRLQTETSPEQVDRAARRKQQLDSAYQTLLQAESRKKHDEQLAWYIAWQKLDADKARQLEQQLKEQQAADEEAAKQAALTAAQWARDEARKAAEEAARQQELARIQAEADERFRSLRLARIQAGDPGEPAPTPDFEDTVIHAEEPASAAHASRATVSIGKKTIVGSLLAVGLVFLGLVGLLPGKPKPTQMPTSGAVPVASATPAQTAASANPSASETAQMQAASQSTSTASPPAKPPLQQKSAKEDGAKAAEALLYQKTLQHVESEHPELNPKLAEHRPDLIAYVAARLQVHIREGYARPKALEIAVRDLETREQTRMALDKLKGQKDQPQPEAPLVLDKGGHAGFDPKCRWVTPEQWSCK
jgi:curved DNA-binding protein CbpA